MVDSRDVLNLQNPDLPEGGRDSSVTTLEEGSRPAVGSLRVKVNFNVFYLFYLSKTYYKTPHSNPIFYQDLWI